MPALHLRATLLPDDDAPTDLWVANGRITFEPQDGAEELAPAGGFVLPGLVDCHTHLTLDLGGIGLPAGSAELVEAGRRAHLDSGTLLLRDIGSISDAALGVRADDGLPRVHGAGRFLAPADGYFGPQQPTTPDGLAAAALAQARSGAPWVKVIGDWPRGLPDFRESVLNYTSDVLTAAVEAVHSAGARLAVHATTRASAVAAVEAGVDSVEHGIGMDESLLKMMAEKNIAWTPTLAIESGVEQMASSTGDPGAVADIRTRFEESRAALAAAGRLGVTVLAGTDLLPAGNVWREVAVLQRAGLEPRLALAAASTAARAFLGEPGIEEGAPADLVLYEQDPRNDPEILAHPALVMLAGVRVAL